MPHAAPSTPTAPHVGPNAPHCTHHGPKLPYALLAACVGLPTVSCAGTNSSAGAFFSNSTSIVSTAVASSRANDPCLDPLSC